MIGFGRGMHIPKNNEGTFDRDVMSAGYAGMDCVVGRAFSVLL